ncbi:MAG: macro domain-containing protein [Bacteroidales bacterium]|nr:macro domain-containing protein [Bacteroidales bacterium]
MRKDINGKIIEIIKGDITRQDDMEAIVNAANARLLTGGGVAGAIYRAAGPELVKESEPLGPIKPDEAVITKAYNLPNQYIIHCLGPVYGLDKPEDILLANCYRNSLQLADNKGIASIAFPAISTGAFGYPLAGAAAVALNTITDQTETLENVKIIRMVLFSETDLNTHVEILQDIFGR